MQFVRILHRAHNIVTTVNDDAGNVFQHRRIPDDLVVFEKTAISKVMATDDRAGNRAMRAGIVTDQALVGVQGRTMGFPA